MQNYGAFLETWGAGIQGSVNITGLASGNQDLSKANWTYQVNLSTSVAYVTFCKLEFMSKVQV